MKAVIDDAIPFIRGVLEPYAEVVYKRGLDICSEDLRDADALIIRSRTNCNAALLDGTLVKCIVTVSAGVSHIDHAYCSARGIFVQGAAGSNSTAVMNYVLSAIYGSAARRGIDLRGFTFGIIGIGHVGSAVETAARRLGFNVLMCDPPRQMQEGSGQRYVGLDTLLASSDIVTIHLPLNESTRGMVNEDFLAKMKVGAFLVNCSRGELIVDEDLIEALPKLGPVILDTWNNEPDINLDLLNKVEIATPHIAGYSLQAKQQSTSIAVRAVARYFGISELYEFFPEADPTRQKSTVLDVSGRNLGELTAAFQYNYPVYTDDFLFRTNPSGFDEMRARYQYRKEFLIE